MRTAYWTVWAGNHVCSEHKSLKAAIRAARACEKNGGMKHVIYEVRLIQPERA